MSTLIAYQGKKSLKKSLLSEIKRHRKADAIIQGTYGQGSGKDWKGCAIGCSIHSLNIKFGKDYPTGDHSVYEKELGIPRMIAYVEDRIFEGLHAETAKDFPLRFAEAVPVGADLSLVMPKLFVWLLTDKEHGVIQHAKEDGKTAIQKVADLYQQVIHGKAVSRDDWRASAVDAAAAYAAIDAAAYADAAYAYAASAATAYAAYAAYASAAATADSSYAATAAAYASDASADASASADYQSAKRDYYTVLADKFISLLKEAPIIS